MTRKELFFSFLEEEWKEEGFEYKKYKNQFVKKFNKDKYIIEFEIWPDFYQVEPNYEIHLAEVEAIKKKAWGKKYERDDWTIRTNRLYLTRYLGLDKEIVDTLETDTEENVDIAAASEMCFYVDVLDTHFFTKYSNIKSLDEYLNQEPQYKRYHINLSKVNNAYLAIIVAYINKNPQLEEIINTYRNFLKADKNMHESYIDKYELLTNYFSQQ